MLRFRGAELVVLPRRWIGPDHEQIPAAGEPLVAGARGQDRDIAGLELDLAALAPAELHARPAPGDPQTPMVPGVVGTEAEESFRPGVAQPLRANSSSKIAAGSRESTNRTGLR